MATAIKLQRLESGVYCWQSPTGNTWRIVRRQWCAPSPGIGWDVYNPSGRRVLSDEERLSDVRDYLSEVSAGLI